MQASASNIKWMDRYHNLKSEIMEVKYDVIKSLCDLHRRSVIDYRQWETLTKELKSMMKL